MEVNLDLLKTFLVFVNSKNIYEAAQKLSISQPSVSLQLKKLEDYFEVPLFSIKGKKKILNIYGQRVYDLVSLKVMEIEDCTKRIKKSFKDHKDLTLRIACRKELIKKVLELNHFPGRLSILSRSSSDSLKLLNEGHVDFAILYDIENITDFSYKEITSTGTHFLISKKSRPNGVDSEDLKTASFYKDINFISYSGEFPYMSSWIKHHKIKKDAIKIELDIDDWDFIANYISKNGGMTLCPETFGMELEDVWKIPVSLRIIPSTNLYLVQKRVNKELISMDEVFRV